MSFFDELKRRNVFRVGIAYTVIGWVLAQVAGFAAETFGAPDWVMKMFVVFLLLGLPIALFFAWAFELTPEGLKREKDVDRSQSITRQTGRKLDRVIIGVLMLAVAMLVIDRSVPRRETDAAIAVTEPAPPAIQEVVATGRPSIAVLPFANLSDDKDYFADGLSEELMNLLAKIPDLKVAGRTSTFSFKGRNEDLREIGAALGVAHVLEGSVRRSGERLRITAQLIEVDDGFHLWSETYDREMADIFDIQDEIAGAITAELRLRLLPESKPLTTSPEAYALYLEALPYISANDDPDAIPVIVDLLERAIELDPGFAKAHEARALTYWMSSGDFVDSAAALPEIQASSQRALELDPTLGLARYYAATSDPSTWTWELEFDAIEAAIAASPDDFNVVRANCANLIEALYLDEAQWCNARMIELEPLSSLSYWRAAMVESALGNRREAQSLFRRAGDLQPEFYVWDLILDAAIHGEFGDAEDLASSAPINYTWLPEDVALMAAWIKEGDHQAIRAWLNEAVPSAGDFRTENSANYWYLAAGMLDDYWREIRRIGLDRNYLGTNTEYLVLYGIAHRSFGFTAHPGFTEYARVTGLNDLWDRRGAPTGCSKESGDWVCE